MAWFNGDKDGRQSQPVQIGLIHWHSDGRRIKSAQIGFPVVLFSDLRQIKLASPWNYGSLAPVNDSNAIAGLVALWQLQR